MTPPALSNPAHGGDSAAAPSAQLAAFRRRHEAWAVVAACALFVALASFQAARQTYPYFDDVTYLELGSQIRALGGPLALLRELFAGRFAESNRHPLYLALLSLFARPGLGYHRDAQALNVVLGVVALLSCWWTARRHFGRAPAAVAVLLIAVGKTFVECASREWCEPLLVAFWAQAVGAILDGAGPAGPRTRWAWLRAGVWSGLAYLTKGTGIFLPTSLALALLLRERARAMLDRRAWTYAAAFVVTASPLLVRNLRLYGSPFYNQNSRFLWIDRLPDYAEVFAPQANDLLPHGFIDYLHHVTPAALAWRVLVGIGETIFILLDAMAPVVARAGGPLHIAAIVAALLATAVALRWIWRRPPGLARTFFLFHAAWTWALLFVFSVNGGNSRYFLPLAATMLVPALAARIVEDVVRAGSLLRSRWALRTGTVAGAAVLAAFAFQPGSMRWPPGMREVQDWLERHVTPGDVYAVDARTHLQPSWLVPQARQVVVSASWEERPVDPALLVEHLRRARVRYVVLDGTSVAHMASPGDPAGRRYLFYDLLPLEADGSLPLSGFPAGMRPAYVDPGSPRRWVVLETPWGTREAMSALPAQAAPREGGSSSR